MPYHSPWAYYRLKEEGKAEEETVTERGVGYGKNGG